MLVLTLVSSFMVVGGVGVGCGGVVVFLCGG